MKSVLEIMGYASAYAGNFLASMTALACATRAEGIQSVFVFPARAKERNWVQTLRDASIPVFFLPQDTRHTMRFLRGLCRRYDVRCVHTHFIDHTVYVPLRLACSGTPHVFHAHSLPRFPQTGGRLRLRRALMHPALTVCVSDAVRQAYEARGFAPCVTVMNGIDFARLDAGEACALRRPAVLMFGYDFTIKGIDTALDAFDACDTQHRYTLAVCTAGRRAEAEAKLRARYGSVPDWVQLLGPRQDVGAYYRSADVFLSASRTEGFAYAVPEAAYCGKPIVLSDIPTHRQLRLPDAEYFPPEDSRALFAAVEKAIAKLPRTENRTFVCARYALDNWTREMTALLTAAIDRRDVDRKQQGPDMGESVNTQGGTDDEQ